MDRKIRFTLVPAPNERFLRQPTSTLSRPLTDRKGDALSSADRKGVRSPKLEAAALNLGGSAKMFPRRSRSQAILELYGCRTIITHRHHGSGVAPAVRPCAEEAIELCRLRNIRPTTSRATPRVEPDSELRRQQVRTSTKGAKSRGTAAGAGQGRSRVPLAGDVGSVRIVVACDRGMGSVVAESVRLQDARSGHRHDNGPETRPESTKPEENIITRSQKTQIRSEVPEDATRPY
jgi:hypothetical protein